jgi:Rps23 Pro-64 3,4-dihydroxylase Tpa1-like proline 4-hydroxylase
MINFKAITSSKLENDPFTFSVIENVICREAIEELLQYLPTKNYYRSVRSSGSDKTYDVVNNILLKLETCHVDKTALPPIWQGLISVLHDRVYIESLSNLLNIDLKDSYQEITFKNYSNNNYLSPHTDKDYVLATHLIFLNLDWDVQWGGELLLHNPNHEVVRRHLPVWNKSFAFVRSDKSWHSVSAVQHEAAVRRVIQIAFWRVNQRVVLPGREEIYEDNT